MHRTGSHTIKRVQVCAEAVSAGLSKTTSKCVLVIDGGGMRGLASLMIIDALMKEISRRNRKDTLPCQVFDLICGTSVGGLISILLGRLGLDCQTALEVYEKAVKTLFEEHKDVWNVIANGQFLETSSFESYIRQIVENIVGSPTSSMKDELDPRKYPRTKACVTMMERAPSFTQIVGSYKREGVAPSVNRSWTIVEALRATIASPIYISPFLVEADKVLSLQDAGFGGFNNPLELASKEWQKLWPNERIGTVISLGTGLRDFLPTTLPETREWGPTPRYVNQFVTDVFQQRLPDVHVYDDIQTNVAYAIRQLARIAADSNIAHQEFNTNHASLCDHYYRIDEPFGLTYLDLVDVFNADIVKTQVKDWLARNIQYVEEIVDSLGVKRFTPVIAALERSVCPSAERGPPATKEIARVMKPPVPPAGTVVEGYNPILDQPRPTDILNYLRDYEVLFIVDDSASMRGSRWLEARDALVEIAEYALKLNVRTVSLRFLNDKTYDRGLQGASALMSRFDRVQPNGSTPIGAVLQVVFNEHLNRIDDAVSNPHLYSKIPPLDIIVLTDGVPTDDPASVIASAVRRLKNKRYHPNTMGVQFVQIADDPGARPVLVDLVKGDNGSIVDTVPYRGVVTSEKLQRILLGGIHPNIRAMLPISLLGT